MNPENSILEGDSKEVLKTIDDNSIDLIVTDPPYGYSFMNKNWDKAVVSTETWKECLRVLKSGAFAFVMSAPRQDVLSRMIVNLQDAGFETNFTSIYWTYASGFPKAANVSKLVDKRNGRNQDIYKPFADYLKQKRLEKKLSMNEIDRILGTNTAYSWWEGRLSGIQLPSKFYYEKLKTILNLDNRFDELIAREEAEREIIETKKKARSNGQDFALPTCGKETKYIDVSYTKSATEQAKKLDGSYAGFQPKPAIEVIVIVMKPLSEKSYVDQALKNGKGITWLDDCRIPFQNEDDRAGWYDSVNEFGYRKWSERMGYDVFKKESEPTQPPNKKGRFPANLLVSDDSLNDGKIRKSGKFESHHILDSKKTDNIYGEYERDVSAEIDKTYGDSGSYSRYFSLDKWYAQFIITPKASSAERNKGCEELPKIETPTLGRYQNRIENGKITNPKAPVPKLGNHHPTVKPLKLMSYLITMGSRENDIILDPFCGSGTTLIAAKTLNRRWIGIELEKEYIEIANKRILAWNRQTTLV